MNTQEQTPIQSTPAAENPQPASVLGPEAVVERLRALRSEMGELTPLSTEQRRALSPRTRTSNSEQQASINIIGALEIVSQSVGQPAGDVRQMVEEANRWTAVEDELRVLLNGVSGANLVRRRRIEFLTRQAANIGSQLARDPAHAVLVPHVQEIRRLRKFSRRKKAATAPETPQPPAPGTTPATSEDPKK